MTSLKSLVNQKILNEVFGKCKTGKWKVLVLDQIGMRIISSCCALNEVIQQGVALVEDITKKREPLKSLEAIYLISPSKSAKLLLNDFNDNPLYDGAHVFFISTCPDDLFEELRRSHASRYIRTCTELNISFLPYESRVFSLDGSKDTFASLFAGTKKTFEDCADQLATVCATMGEYPRIAFRTDDQALNIRFATLVQQKLEWYKQIEPDMKEGRTQLVIVDRGFDCITPVLHDLSFQSMVHDLLEIRNDAFHYKDNLDDKELILDESSPLWQEFRHQHIALVSKNLLPKIRQFNDDNRVMESTSSTENVDIKRLGEIVKNVAKFKKEKSLYTGYLRMSEDCTNRFRTYVNKMCLVEQDLAVGTDVTGEKLQSMNKVFDLFLDEHIQPYDKIRIILLYVLSNNGITEENLKVLERNAKIPDKDKSIISNSIGALKKLGIDLDPSKKKVSYPRKNRIDENTYDTARWTPTLMDIIDDAIEDKLNTRHFQYLNSDKPVVTRAIPVSLRGGGGAPNGTQAKPVQSRLIVFVLGGITYSEMKCAYEATQKSRCEVFVGSDQIISPTDFVKNLCQLGN